MRTKSASKNYYLDERKVKRVKRILKANSEQQAIERALEMVLDDERIAKSHAKFLKSNVEIQDALGHPSS